MSEDARKRLVEEFGRLSEAPGAVGEFRRLVLDLAVRGKLVEQDPLDEPAARLVRRMMSCKNSLIGDARIRQGKACREPSLDEIPFVIPETWAWTMLAEITDVGTGSTPSRVQPSFWTGGSIPWITSGSTSHAFITAGDELITEEAVKAHHLRLYLPGTLLVALYGQGKTRGQVSSLNIKATINQACAAVCPLDGFEDVHAYLKLLLRQNYDKMRSLAAGGAQPNLNVQKIKELLVPLPPLAEQKRIVAKVDEWMALCDRLEAAQTVREFTRDRLAKATLQRLNPSAEAENGASFREHARFFIQHLPRMSTRPEHVAALRQTILNLAVRGKLVDQDPRDEPAGVLLKRIAEEKARLVAKGETKFTKPTPAIRSDEAAFRIPSTWAWARLSDISSYIQRGKSPKYANNDGLPVVSQKCIQWSGLDLSAAKLISRESIDSYEAIRFLRDGDLLWNSTGTGTIGRIIKITAPPARLVCDSHVTVVRCFEVNVDYVRAWLRSDHVYGVIEERAAGSTNQIELTLQMAIGQIVPLPPLAEQKRIVAKVDQLINLCDQLEQQITTAQTKTHALLKAILQQITTSSASALV